MPSPKSKHTPFNDFSTNGPSPDDAVNRSGSTCHSRIKAVQDGRVFQQVVRSSLRVLRVGREQHSVVQMSQRARQRSLFRFLSKSSRLDGMRRRTLVESFSMIHFFGYF